MEASLWIEIVVIVLLMLGNGFFAASKIVVVSAQKSRLEQQAQSGRGGAALARMCRSQVFWQVELFCRHHTTATTYRPPIHANKHKLGRRCDG